MQDCVLYGLKVWSNLSILILIMCAWWGGLCASDCNFHWGKKRLLDHGAGVKGICKFLNMDNWLKR